MNEQLRRRLLNFRKLSFEVKSTTKKKKKSSSSVNNRSSSSSKRYIKTVFQASYREMVAPNKCC